MKGLRCRLGFHDPQGWATKPGVFGAGRCARCYEAVGGIAITDPPPTRTYEGKADEPPTLAVRRVAPVWLRGVFEFETTRAAQR